MIDTSSVRTALDEFLALIGDGGSQQLLDDIKTLDAPLGTPDPLDRGYTPGELRDSGEVDPGSAVDAHYTTEMRFISDHALWTEEGTSPHTIDGRNPPPLVFYWPRTGKVMFLRHVNHPGNPAQHWFERALTEDRWAEACQRVANFTEVRAA